ncbi:DUF1764-domain-containing protein [Sanghuangporus baumii]|uniref:DUF1764-domain-containing protein n=1 Tax=Sanghuangporus baumii TaxID=108892 RepID=A0A9Q5HQ79_SANBA|nr:DUF1764-domain-containing protein [Sanghuangporus baumii]
MPVTSEIDDIFAGKVSKTSSAAAKGNAKAVDEASLPSSASATKKKKSKKRKRQEADNEHDSKATPEISRLNWKGRDAGNSGGAGRDEDDASEKKSKSKRPRVVETVQDPSATLSPTTSSSNHLKSSQMKKNKSKSAKEGEKEGGDLERFKDSRGSGPRKRTEEGYLVYKEDELGIRDSGGNHFQTHRCAHLTVIAVFDVNCDITRVCTSALWGAVDYLDTKSYTIPILGPRDP